MNTIPNNKHNLMTQLVEDQKSLWRIENHYINDANSDQERDFWTSLKETKESHIKTLTDLLKECL